MSMLLADIIREISGLEQAKAALQDKQQILKRDQQVIKDKLSDTNKRIAREKQIDRQRKDNNKSVESRKVTEGKTKNVSAIIRLTSGKVIGYIHSDAQSTHYFNGRMQFVAYENKNGTFKAGGAKVSNDAIGLWVLGRN